MRSILEGGGGGGGGGGEKVGGGGGGGGGGLPPHCTCDSIQSVTPLCAQRLKSPDPTVLTLHVSHSSSHVSLFFTSASSNQSLGDYPECRREREAAGEASLLVSPLVVAGIVIGLVLFLSCITIIIGSFRKSSHLHLRASYGEEEERGGRGGEGRRRKKGEGGEGRRRWTREEEEKRGRGGGEGRRRRRGKEEVEKGGGGEGGRRRWRREEEEKGEGGGGEERRRRRGKEEVEKGGGKEEKRGRGGGEGRREGGEKRERRLS
uniref:Uncharacterized protein n=1 Tax=Knipowitschia caucasica TaxID=637954 RepID=A0AAV2JSS4_KNICA